MDDVGRLWLGVIITLVAILLMGFFTACENSIIEANDARIKKLAETNRKAKRLLRITEKPNRLMLTSLVFRTTMIVAMSVICTNYFYTSFRNELVSWLNVRDSSSSEYILISVVAFVLLICIITVIISAVGINLPKRLAGCKKLSEKFAMNVSGIFAALMTVLRPLEFVATKLTDALLRLWGIKNSFQPESVTEEEILMMVDAVNETGGIEESQAEMINNIFQFDDLEVRDVMTHRIDCTAVEKNAPISQAIAIVLEDGFSRLPVYDSTIDNICGVIFAKDLLKLASCGNTDKAVSLYMREIKYIPETNHCGELFEMFTSQKVQIAVAVDEYGGTAGIITMEDLLEAIVGSIQDEYDDEEEEIQEITPNTFDIAGNCRLEDVIETLEIENESAEDFDTIGGLLIDILGHIPKEDKIPPIKWGGVDFTIIKASDKRIEKVRACIPNDETKEVDGQA